MRTPISLAAAVAVLALSGPLAAQDKFPSGPIKMIIAAPEGNAIDAIHRELAELASADLGVPITFENRPGSAGRESIAALLDAEPDGHTIAAVPNATLTIAPQAGVASYGLGDIAPVMQTTARAPLVVCVHPRFDADDGEDFVDHVKDNPGKFRYGTDGPGTITEFAAARIFRSLKLDLTPVAYDEPGGVLRGYLERKIEVYVGNIWGIIGQTKEGYARCLFATSEEPPRSFREIDALDDLDAEDEVTEFWWGLAAPKGTPPERIAALAAAFGKAAGGDQIKFYLMRRHENVAGGTPEDMAALLESESAAFAKVMKEIGLGK